MAIYVMDDDAYRWRDRGKPKDAFWVFAYESDADLAGATLDTANAGRIHCMVGSIGMKPGGADMVQLSPDGTAGVNGWVPFGAEVGA